MEYAYSEYNTGVLCTTGVVLGRWCRSHNSASGTMISVQPGTCRQNGITPGRVTRVNTLRHEVLVPGRKVCISVSSSFHNFWVVNCWPVRWFLRLMDTRKLHGKSYGCCGTGYQKTPRKKLNYSTMINFGPSRLLRKKHVCRILNDQTNHACESRSWNFLCSQSLEIATAIIRAKICYFILDDEYLYHCWRRYSHFIKKLIP